MKKWLKFSFTVLCVVVAFIAIAGWLWLMTCQLAGMLKPCYDDTMMYKIANFITESKCGDAGKNIKCRQ